MRLTINKDFNSHDNQLLFVTFVLPFGGNLDNLINTIRVKSKIFDMAGYKQQKMTNNWLNLLLSIYRMFHGFGPANVLREIG